MARESFLVTPFVYLDPAEVSVSPFTGSGGDASVVLQLGGGVSMHVYDEALLVRLAEVAARGLDLLAGAVTGQPPLPAAGSEVAA